MNETISPYELKVGDLLLVTTSDGRHEGVEAVERITKTLVHTTKHRLRRNGLTQSFAGLFAVSAKRATRDDLTRIANKRKRFKCIQILSELAMSDEQEAKVVEKVYETLSAMKGEDGTFQR